MLKMDITYEDFNGKQRVEAHYFNMTRREVIRLQMRHMKLVDKDTQQVTGSFQEYLEEVVSRGDGGEIANLFEDIILDSYGEKSEDGRSFVKNADLREKFSQTAAYDQLFYQFVTDENAMKVFVNNVFPKGDPKDDRKNIQPASSHGVMKVGESVEVSESDDVKSNRKPTDEEIRNYLESKNDN